MTACKFITGRRRIIFSSRRPGGLRRSAIHPADDVMDSLTETHPHLENARSLLSIFLRLAFLPSRHLCFEIPRNPIRTKAMFRDRRADCARSDRAPCRNESASLAVRLPIPVKNSADSPFLNFFSRKIMFLTFDMTFFGADFAFKLRMHMCAPAFYGGAFSETPFHLHGKPDNKSANRGEQMFKT